MKTAAGIKLMYLSKSCAFESRLQERLPGVSPECGT